MPRYETKYYILYTDVPPEQAKEAALRMSRMAEEYHTRTREFSGAIRTKFPFYLYRNRQDYLAVVGKEGTDGLFDGTSLYAVGGEQLNDRSWHVVQHEGFHQFAHAVIGGVLPSWVNEGLAEYFGEALFTGDGYISGIVPDWRLKRLQDEIRDDKLMTIEKMMSFSTDEWNSKPELANYDQAWSMVHFLAHGENGKYQKAFAAMMIELSRATPPEKAWNDNFGSSTGFEAKWKSYWLNQSPNPTADLYTQATVARLTSFLARAAAQKQTFSNYPEFRSAALAGKIKMSQTDWLPTDLLLGAIADADDMGKKGAVWLLENKPAPQIQCDLNGKWVGTFALKNGEVVRVDVKRPRP